MNTSSFDADIARLESEIEGLVPDMEQAARAFQAAAVSWAVQFYGEQIDAAVRNYPHLIIQMTPEQRSALKVGLGTLQEDAPKLVDDTLAPDEYWDHRRGRDVWRVPAPKGYSPPRYGFDGNRPPKDLDKALRSLASRIGALLDAHGLIGPGDRATWTMGASPEYRSPLAWSEDMRKAIESYGALWARARALGLAIVERTAQKVQAEARSLMDRA